MRTARRLHMAHLPNVSPLLTALRRTPSHRRITVRSESGRVESVVSQHEAVALVIGRESDYDFHGLPNSRRVDAIIRVAVSTTPKWERCYRNSSAPVLQPGLEWLLTRTSRKEML
jgi:hypothetical protein